MKKVKLFTTIASLCLAVALMAFGVYAAGATAGAKVSGSVSFTATEINVDLVSVTYTLGNGLGFKGEAPTGNSPYAITISENKGTIPELEITGTENLTVTVTATFKNESDKAALCGFKATVTDAADDGISATASADVEGEELAANATNKTVTATITLSIADAKLNGGVTFDIDFWAGATNPFAG